MADVEQTSMIDFNQERFHDDEFGVDLLDLPYDHYERRGLRDFVDLLAAGHDAAFASAMELNDGLREGPFAIAERESAAAPTVTGEVFQATAYPPLDGDAVLVVNGPRDDRRTTEKYPAWFPEVEQPVDATDDWQRGLATVISIAGRQLRQRAKEEVDRAQPAIEYAAAGAVAIIAFGVLLGRGSCIGPMSLSERAD